MKPFFVIDWARMVHVVYAENREAAAYKHNGYSTSQADITIPAECNAHGQIIHPIFPDWMENLHFADTAIKFASNKKQIHEINEQTGQYHMWQVDAVESSEKYFVNRRDTIP